MFNISGKRVFFRYVSLSFKKSINNLLSDKTNISKIYFITCNTLLSDSSFKNSGFFVVKQLKMFIRKNHYLINYQEQFTFVAKPQFFIKTNRL